jgi:hypothetical protein
MPSPPQRGARERELREARDQLRDQHGASQSEVHMRPQLHLWQELELAAYAFTHAHAFFVTTANNCMLSITLYPPLFQTQWVLPKTRFDSLLLCCWCLIRSWCRE